MTGHQFGGWVCLALMLGGLIWSIWYRIVDGLPDPKLTAEEEAAEQAAAKAWVKEHKNGPLL